MIELHILLDPDGQRGTVSQERPGFGSYDFIGMTMVAIGGTDIALSLSISLPDESWTGFTLSAKTLCDALLPVEGVEA